MKLLELVRTDATGDDTISKSQEYGRLLNKEPILVKDSPGFASSRLGVCLGAGRWPDFDSELLLCSAAFLQAESL